MRQEGGHWARKTDGLFFGIEIHEHEDGGMRTDAAADFDAIRNGTKRGSHAAGGDHPLRERGHEIGVENRADISDAAFAEGMRDDARLAVEPAIAAGIT